SNSLATPPPCPLPYTPPVPSSPIRSSSDPNEVLTQFFDWLTAKSNASQAELLESVKNKLLDEDWSLDALRDDRRGGAMTSTIWESYGFKLGTLAKIRSRISEFKQQQRPQSRVRHGNPEDVSIPERLHCNQLHHEAGSIFAEASIPAAECKTSVATPT
ncbi:MAG: hypothetical protein M1840_003094, partial [Geoglossum simile]